MSDTVYLVMSRWVSLEDLSVYSEWTPVGFEYQELLADSYVDRMKDVRKNDTCYRHEYRIRRMLRL